VCDFDDGSGETASVFQWHHVRRARTWHLCATCGVVIPAGADYWRNFSIIDRRPSTEKQCADCHGIGERFGTEHRWTPSPSYLLECVQGCVDSDGPDSKWVSVLERMQGTMIDVATVKKQLPQGWSLEECAGEIILLTETRRAVTIDGDGRFFQLGFGTHPPRPREMAAKYAGRGWATRLIDDAIRALGPAA
jgi:hypothetical protein